MLEDLIKKTVRESSIYFIAQIITAIIGFITLVVFARIFVPAEYGLIALALLAVSIGSIITGNWLTSSVNRFFPYYKRIGKLDIFYSSALLGMLISIIGFSLVIIPLFFLWAPHLGGFGSLIPLIALLVPLTMGYEIFLTNFRVKQQAKLFTIFQLSRTIWGFILGISLAVFLDFGVEGILWGHIIALLFFYIIMFKILFLTNGYIKLSSISLPATKQFVSFGFPAMAATIGTWILIGADRYIIEIFYGSNEVGLYSMGYSIGDVTIGMLVTALMLGIGPSLINVWESDKRRLTGELLSELTRLLILIALPATIGLSILARPATRLLATNAYYPGSAVIPFVASGAFIYGLSLLSYTGLGLAKRTDIVARNYFTAAILNIVLNIVFVPKFGYIAAAVTTTVSYAVLLCLNIWSANKYLKWIINYRSLRNSVIASVVMGIVVFPVTVFLSVPWLICVIGIALGIGCYFGTLLLLKEFSAGEIAEVKKLLRRG